MQEQRPAARSPRGREAAGAAWLGGPLEAADRPEGAGADAAAGSRGCAAGPAGREPSAPRRLEGQGGPAAGESGVGDGSGSCAAEPHGSWGDFEGFRGASDQPDTFSSLEGPARRPSGPDARGCLRGDRTAGTSERAALPPDQASLSYENIFKLVFQEVPVQQMTEDICTLRHFLEKHNEENTSCKPLKKQFCSESQKLWRILQDEDSTSTSRCLWSKSHCQDNFLLVLGIDAAQKDLSGGKNHVLEDSNLKETEELTEVNGFNLNNCKALIQTKLSGSSAPQHNSLFMYNLFLKKTPSSGNMQYITIPRKKKLFTAWNLKMKFFNSDVC